MKINKKVLACVLVGFLGFACIISVKYDEFNQKRERAIEYVKSNDSMSKQRIYEHMKQDGYDSDLIQYAMENGNLDWNKNALRCAKFWVGEGLAKNENELSKHLLDSEFEKKEIQYAINNLTEEDWENGKKEYQKTIEYMENEEYQDDTEYIEDTEENIPTEYKSALTKAKLYSDEMFMSKEAIYDQLTSEYGEKFTKEAAQYAVDNLDANFKENALEKAKTYQDEMSMSPSAIYDQLTSKYGEKFTKEEAQYAIDNLE